MACKFKRFAAALSCVFLSTLPLYAGVPTLDESQPYVPGEVLIQWKAGAGPSDQKRVLSSFSESHPLRTRSDIFRAKMAGATAVEDAVRLAKADPAVQWAQPNYIYRVLQACAGPTAKTDPYFTSGTLNQSCGSALTDPNWPFTQINAPQAWAALPLSCPALSPVTVAVIDTGISSSSSATHHPDLPASIFVTGFNEVANNTDTTDDFGHGTWVTGIIAAQWNNAASSNTCTLNAPASFNGGMAGVAGYPGLIKIMPIKVLDGTGSGTTAEVINGTNFAVANGARVLNFSLGATSPDTLEQQSIENAITAGCVVIASSGNESTTRRFHTLDYPAGYPGVISVGGTQANQSIASYSNGGTGASGVSLTLVAPGGAASAGFDTANDIFSTMLNCPSPTTQTADFTFDPCDNNYGVASGTSASAPFVTGGAALMLAVNPSLTSSGVSQILATTTTQIIGSQGTWNQQSGWGLLNLSAAVSASLVGTTPLPTSTPTGTFTSSFTPTATASRSMTPTPTFTPANTATSTASLTASSSATATPSLTVTRTATSTPTNTPTFTNTFTSSPSPSATASRTPTASFTATGTATFTASNTSTGTPTGTATNTPTKTSTPTPTTTGTSTPTFTASGTPSPTSTSTPTATFSATSTSSGTMTATSTPTSSGTPTSTPSGTFTFTPTSTGTATPSRTATSTFTATATGTFTATASSTPTFTPTSTLSATPSPTFTPSNTSTPSGTMTSTASSTTTSTPTETFTRTPGDTATPSSTASSTASATPTASTTKTPTNTPKATASETASNTLTQTSTPSQTPSTTPTQTPSFSPTSTHSTTATPTNSVTASATASQIPTASLMATGTSSLTVTPTVPASQTPTATFTFSTSFTPTPTLSPTFTPLNFFTFTPSSTPTPTSTPAIVPTPGYSISLPYPNPSNGSFVHWDIRTSESLVVQISVFTAGGVKIFQETMNVTSNTTLVWDLKDRWGNSVPNGIYFVRFRIRASSGSSTQIFKVIVLN